MDRGEAARELVELLQRPVRIARRDAEHVAEHRDADLDAHAREKADEHGTRQEIGKEPEPEDPRQQQQRRGQQRHHSDQRHVRARWPQAPSGISPLAKIAAVAESAATTRWREDPNTAKATSGSRTV